MNIFIAAFWILLVVCVGLFFYTKSTVKSSNDPAFRKFQMTYLVVYLLAMAGDWLQGPYVYALYEHYGMTVHNIEVLFVAGFGSSMLFGTFVGSIADKYGRRANCFLYGVLYGLSCTTKHFNNFYILLLGRFLGGTATSILYSAFESWLIFEHNKRGYDSDLLGTVFSHAVLGNSLVAVTAGVVAQNFADHFGFVAPFDVALCILTILCIVVLFTWSENYGDTKSNVLDSFKTAAQSIRTDPKILCLGLIQSLFEGSMYTFVLEWTPALTPHTDKVKTTRALLSKEDGHIGTIPHGYVFAGFMVAIMIGSSLFKLFSRCTSVESFMRPVLLLSSVSLLMPIIFPGNQLVIFIGFLVFEVCVGLFWPSLSTMRGKYVPEATRATIMNFFRIPLNLIVVIILTQNLKMTVIFECCVAFLFVAFVAQHWLYRLSLSNTKTTSLNGKTDRPTSSTEDKKPLMDEEASV
ncbi:molybdate-anion transporter-like [Tubulanus polymorphus]|uniref:molybdate-anion transporter-like n=1 Tax=Tubulanus polymorphus TaxID=672921 RepID=UPI003DA5C5CD